MGALQPEREEVPSKREKPMANCTPKISRRKVGGAKEREKGRFQNLELESEDKKLGKSSWESSR